jgi:hypothetical protein
MFVPKHFEDLQNQGKRLQSVQNLLLRENTMKGSVNNINRTIHELLEVDCYAHISVCFGESTDITYSAHLAVTVRFVKCKEPLA